MTAIKLNLSFEPHTAELVRARARALGKPVSRYLADLVESDAQCARDQLAAEGYRALSADNREFADASTSLAQEIWPEWSEARE
jgi:hypothetical protein